MTNTNSNSLSSPTTNASADPQPAAPPTPEQVVEQLRALASNLGEATPLTPEEKRKVRQYAGVSNTVVQAQINLIDIHERVGIAVGAASPEVRQLADEANRWNAVEDQLKRMFQAVYGANLVRRQKLAIIGAQASLVGQALAKEPELGEIRTQMQEIKRVKRLARRKASPPAPPPETPGSTDPHGSSGQ